MEVSFYSLGEDELGHVTQHSPSVNLWSSGRL
jgi:hypothetical protein